MDSEWNLSSLIKIYGRSHKCSIMYVLDMPISVMNGILETMLTIDSYLVEARRIFKNRRNLVVKKVNETADMRVNITNGAFYVFSTFEHDIKSTDLPLN